MIQLLVEVDASSVAGVVRIWRPYAARGRASGLFPTLPAVSRQVKRLAAVGAIRQAVALRGHTAIAHWKIVDRKARRI